VQMRKAVAANSATIPAVWAGMERKAVLSIDCMNLCHISYTRYVLIMNAKIH